jgi:twitching motility protein PilT
VSARLDQILGNLDRDGVTEVMLESGRPVQVREEGVYVPVSSKAIARDELDTILKGTGIAMPASDGSQPPIDVAIGDRWLRVRVSRRGSAIAVRMEKSKAPRTRASSKAPASRTTTRDRAPVAARTATRGKRTTTAPRSKGSTAPPRTKSSTAAPRTKGATAAPRTKGSTASPRTKRASTAPSSFDLDLGDLDAPTARPRPQPAVDSRAPTSQELDLGGLELPPFRPSQPLGTFGRWPATPSTERETAEIPRLRSVPQVNAQRETAEIPPPAIELAAPPEPAARARPATRSSVGAPKLAELVAAARTRRATDLHVATGRPVLVRVAGEMVSLEPGGRALAGADEMLLSLLDPDQKARLAQVGYVDLAVEAGGGRLRANVSRYQGGIKGTFRLAAPAPQSLQELGLPRELAKVVSHHQGLVVVAGPSGHGKTTTLAALVDLVNASKAHHIITVEDPIEIVYPRKTAVVSQREAGRHTKSFATALKASLREDPDVIVIGELRDRETVEIALTAAETGHLVLATMSTPSAAKTIDRLIDVFPAEEQQQVRASVAGALRAIVAQRLLPAIGGGVVPAIELVTGVLPLAVLIRDDKLFQLPNLMQRGKAYGMIRLEDSIAELVRIGKVRAP